MWSNLPFDLLANVFSFLSPDSLIRAKFSCRNWRTCVETTFPPEKRRHHAPWFIALPTRNRGDSCFALNPVDGEWRTLRLDFISDPIRPIGPIGGLLLVRVTSTTALRLAVCYPFTRQFRLLRALNVPRTNPAVGAIGSGRTPKFPFLNSFKIYVAGGMSESPCGGASYEPTLEMYDSHTNSWQIVGPMPVELAVRPTVWTPNESAYSDGFLYWVTSARAYCIIRLDISTNRWTALTVPMADKLEFAALVSRNGKLALVGGRGGGEGGACIWELGDSEIWRVIGKMLFELGTRFLGGKGSWGSTQCVVIDGAVWLFRDLGSGMAVWREAIDEGRSNSWRWDWIEGCCSVKGKEVVNLPIRGVACFTQILLLFFFDFFFLMNKIYIFI